MDFEGNKLRSLKEKSSGLRQSYFWTIHMQCLQQEKTDNIDKQRKPIKNKNIRQVLQKP